MVDGARVGAGLHEELDADAAADEHGAERVGAHGGELGARVVQRRAPGAVAVVDVRALGDEQLHHVREAELARAVQRRDAALVAVGEHERRARAVAPVQQPPHLAHAVVGHRRVQLVPQRQQLLLRVLCHVVRHQRLR